MTITRWDPFAELSSVQSQLNRLFGQTWGDRAVDEAVAQANLPPVDVRENGAALIVTAELPGIKRDDIAVRVEGNRLTIEAEKKAETEADGESWRKRERTYGRFARVFTLSEAVDADKLSAKFEDGVLTVTLPKREQVKPRTVRVQ